ncbi:CDV3-like protein [Elysia marginata]|uniref:CDV3-like protein n=1 Tax=Elysia marginata TaxID=1093978 RepID=A0AAV4JBQ0_9GAST|nr:CDV3-like protein [Elysia marginata]
MADSSLDDFFAKKDKSKKKLKVKGDGDDTTKQTKKEKKKRDKESSGLGSNNILGNQEDEEWKDFEEEKKADYTGLRIQTLQIAAKEEQDKESGDCDDDGDDEDGENRGKKDGASGPWAKNNTTVPEPSQPIVQAEAVKESPAAAKVPGKYVPPAQRAAAMSSASSHPMANSRRKKEAPNMNSEVDFPTLGGAPAGRAQGSYDYIDTTGGRKGVNLTLENKFAALQD